MDVPFRPSAERKLSCPHPISSCACRPKTGSRRSSRNAIRSGARSKNATDRCTRGACLVHALCTTNLTLRHLASGPNQMAETSPRPELLEITLRSVEVTLSALVLACLIALPFGTFRAVHRFRSRRFFVAVVNALMGLLLVVVDLIVYVLSSRSGPCGIFYFCSRPRHRVLRKSLLSLH